MSGLACIGIDWGTTHRRVSVLDAEGRLRLRVEDDQGALACRGRFAASVDELLARLPPDCATLPLRMAGMVGSTVGWQEVPYVGQEVPLDALRHHLVQVAEAPDRRDWSIVPGMRVESGQGEVDVMRGEETQLLGALALGGAAADGCWVLPGTHSKWVLLRQGRVQALRTCLSGELYALLARHGTLSNVLQQAEEGGAVVDQAFAHGVMAAQDPALSHQLFGLRARVVTGRVPAAGAAGWLSGLLIGSEWHDAVRRQLVDGVVRLIAAPALAARHLDCARQLGLPCVAVDAQAVEVAAWRALAGGLGQA